MMLFPQFMKNKGKIILETRDNIGRLTIDNPPQNYLNSPGFIPLEELQSWISRCNLKGLIITGAGRHFSAGADLDNLFEMSTGTKMDDEMKRGKELLSYLENLEIPVIAAIQGACFGGGLEIALAAHIRVCNKKAIFAFPESNYNLLPGLGGTVRLNKLIPAFDSLTMILGGDMINADEALLLNIVDHISEDPEEFSFNLLKKMTDDRPLKVINYVMRAVFNTQHLTDEEALAEETRMFCELAREEGLRRKEEAENS